MWLFPTLQLTLKSSRSFDLDPLKDGAFAAEVKRWILNKLDMVLKKT